ncbi:MAG: SUMF1/EgtB/PvdO family nonheme iron enzyme [Chloroflexi bacterium]|nr:SUMF1/EgtB/PvdO family nonheme iron enzyme [Chloroflexota bacterium]
MRNKSQTLDVPAFAIAKYPVTNAQYRLFVTAGGYAERRWWTEAGWEAKAKGWKWDGSQWVETNQPWAEPRYWNDPNWKSAAWNGDDYPVTGVSWYEATAYCAWLSAETGESIGLPGEQQWQRAAQGSDGRAYPWGKIGTLRAATTA